MGGFPWDARGMHKGQRLGPHYPLLILLSQVSNFLFESNYRVILHVGGALIFQIIHPLGFSFNKEIYDVIFYDYLQ
jgi:hypothetical protein